MTWQWFERDDIPAAGQPSVDLPPEGADPGATPLHRPPSLHTALEGSEPIARARQLTRSFLVDLQNIHGIHVSNRACDTVELVVSELVTNIRKYAPGPSLLTLDVRDGCIEVGVWDTNPDLPTIPPPDPARVGQHGLEIIMATAITFQIHRVPVGKRIAASIQLTDHSNTDSTGR
ncbi:ATP-binding protein [Streptomyces scabiei]|uniref:ATP-binding protein n=1 Tax=Streptomyces scabiei TaxID=1930 RepID=UPI0029BCA7FA|nr:ATP-binding protein [Streptomyces scabiei]MDX3209919.1 ATP-binding protein [Streptomyces scabiei]